MSRLALPAPPATALERLAVRPWGAVRAWARGPEQRALVCVAGAVALLGLATILAGAGLHLAGEPVRWSAEEIDDQTGRAVPVTHALGETLTAVGALPFFRVVAVAASVAVLLAAAAVLGGLLVGLLLGLLLWRWVQPSPRPSARGGRLRCPSARWDHAAGAMVGPG